MSNLVPLFVALALGGAFLAALLGRRSALTAGAISALTTLTLLILSVFSVFEVRGGPPVIYAIGSWAPPLGISMVLDGLTVFMLVTVNLIGLIVVIYSFDYMKTYSGLHYFHALFLLMMAGMNGVIVTGDLFNLFVFLEVASVASYSLVAFGTRRHELEAAFKYAILGSLGSMLLLIGIILLYAYASTLNLADLAETLAAREAGPFLALIAALFVLGFGLKAAVVPFHAWLPDAHPAAPAPISAMLSGVLIKSLGVYALCRVFFGVLGVSPRLSETLVLLGVVSMLVGVLLALGQWDVKRLLAYHSISQIGYIMLGIGLATPLGFLGGLFHLFNHSVFKSLLFLDSGSLEQAAGTRDLRRMGGLGARMRITGGTTLIASLSISGVPPFNGFWSKLLIILAAIEAGRPGLAAWAVLASILTLASFTKVMKYAFMGALPDRYRGVTEAPFSMRFSLALLAVLCILGGLLLLPGIREAFLYPASDVLAGTVNSTQIALARYLP